MPLEAVVTCVGGPLRKELIKRMDGLDPNVRVIARQLLEALPQCADGQPLGVRIQEASAQARGRRKRPMSAYNQHMSDCLKGGGTFLSCVEQWRERKRQDQGGLRSGAA
jgi:hypothetical protein